MPEFGAARQTRSDPHRGGCRTNHPRVVSDRWLRRSGHGCRNDDIGASTKRVPLAYVKGALFYSNPAVPSDLQTSLGRAARSGYGPRGRVIRRRGLASVPWPHPKDRLARLQPSASRRRQFFPKDLGGYRTGGAVQAERSRAIIIDGRLSAAGRSSLLLRRQHVR